MIDDLFEREIGLTKERKTKTRKFISHGLHDHVCTVCGEDDPLCLIEDHAAGRQHDEALRLLCENCDCKRTADQRCDPPPGPNPKNVFEVIGRWLLSMASYFKLLTDKLRQFGLFLIDLAKKGYGDELTFD